MKINLYVTRDMLAGETTSAICQFKNDALAKRNFENSMEQIVQEGNPQKIPVRDLQLFRIGVLDTETLELENSNELICNAAEIVAKFDK